VVEWLLSSVIQCNTITVTYNTITITYNTMTVTCNTITVTYKTLLDAAERGDLEVVQWLLSSVI
jgi:hypothetical protein